jgi:hypothetical protein
MFIIAAIVSTLLLILAGSNLFVDQYDPDELSNMGIQQK